MLFNRTCSLGLGAGVAVAALALASCSGGSHSPVPSGSASPIATVTPETSSSPSASSTPIAAALGVAYLPDGGNGQGFTGLQIVHFEDTNSHLLPSSSTQTPQPVTFAGAVGPFRIAVDGLDAIAAVSQSTSPVYTIVQSVFGTLSSATVPVGTGYNVTELPTPTPGVTAAGTPTPIPSPLPVLTQITSLGIYGSSSTGVGIAAGPDTTGFLGVTQLANAGPIYGGFVPFTGQTPTPITAARPYVTALSTTTQNTLLARGASDLLAYKIAIGGEGYTFTLGGQDTTLGLPAPELGAGVMAIDPADGGRAVVGQTDPGDGTNHGVTLITGLPGAITKTSVVSVGSTPRSIAVTSGGAFAVVGTDLGFVVVSGVDTGTLALMPAFNPSSITATLNSPTYIGCDGQPYHLANVTSVGFSSDLNFLAVLGNQPSAACTSGRTSTLIVLPFDQTTGVGTAPSPTPSTTPAPRSFVVNNVIAPATNQDYMVVR